jgi:small subunit ribosomal protein S2
MEEGKFDALTKKERRQIEREIEKLGKALGGIKQMDSLPSVLFIIDPNKEQIAQKEANRLGIPVVAVTDTNCNPERIDFIIPGNDDAIKSIRIFASSIADACLRGLDKRQDRIRAEVEAEKTKKEPEAPKIEEVIPEKSRAFVSKAIKEETVEVDEEMASARVRTDEEAESTPETTEETQSSEGEEPKNG